MEAEPRRKPGRPKDPDLEGRRREEILDVAAKTFARHGFANADVQFVADELGVGKGTVYRYFPSKRDLFLAAADRGMRRLHEHTEAAGAGVSDPLERIARCVRAYLEFFGAHPEYAELLVQERAEFKDRKRPTYFVHRDANIGPWLDLLRGLIREGRVRDVPVDRIADALSGLVYGTMFTNYFTGRTGSYDEQARNIIDIAYHGILSDTERKRRAASASPPPRSRGL